MRIETLDAEDERLQKRFAAEFERVRAQAATVLANGGLPHLLAAFAARCPHCGKLPDETPG